MSRNKVFRCAYFSMHSRIKFMLFNDFPSYFYNAEVHYITSFVMSNVISKVQTYSIRRKVSIIVLCLIIAVRCSGKRPILRYRCVPSNHKITLQ